MQQKQKPTPNINDGKRPAAHDTQSSTPYDEGLHA
jgi:hypothetical protein